MGISRQSLRFVVFSVSFAASLSLLMMGSQPKAQSAQESLQEQARRLHMRLTGTQPSRDALAQMMNLIEENRTSEAAFVAMEDLNFYRITLFHMFSSDSTVSGSADLDLTDFSATVVGLVKDNERFDQVLYGDVFYTSTDDLMTYDITIDVGGTPTAVPVNRAGEFSPFVRDNDGVNNFGQNPPTGKVRPPFFLANAGNPTDIRYDANTHYQDLYTRFNDWPNRIEKRSQSQLYSYLRTDQRVSEEDIAGILTTRQSASEFFNMGTNRRMFRFAAKNYLCRDMEQLHDSSAPDFRVRQDIDRSPGGDSRAYALKCVGCHAGMDAFAGAFAFFDFSGNRLIYNRNALLNGGNKQFRQDHVYTDGYRLVDNSWINLWNRGPNEALGWRDPAVGSSIQSGIGAKTLGALLASTEAFGNCMAERAFKRVCFRSPTPRETAELEAIGREFENGMSEYSAYEAENPYNLRAVFAKVSDMCF